MSMCCFVVEKRTCPALLRLFNVQLFHFDTHPRPEGERNEGRLKGPARVFVL